MDNAEYIDPFERLLKEAAPLDKLRGFERGALITELWAALEASGFLDVLVPEEAGGAGLPAPVVIPLLQALGRHLVPAPVAETMIARALLGRADAEPIDGPILIATASADGAGGYRSGVLPHASVAQVALVDTGAAELIVTELGDAVRMATGVHASQARSLWWKGEPPALATIPRPSGGLRPLAAVVRAAAIAGAAEAVARLTIDYAGTRMQFGKAIGRNQAVQQQLAVLAEQVVMARAAAQIGLRGGVPPTSRAAAIAKQIASRAAEQIAAIAHAVHGAIGISEEYDLQLYTRRLHEWGGADGSASYWATLLGEDRLTSDARSIEFLRSC